MTPEQVVVTRTGDFRSFDPHRILSAVRRALKSCQKPNAYSAEELTGYVVRRLRDSGIEYLSVEKIQNTIEEVLGEYGEYEAQSNFRFYREARTEERLSRPIPEDVYQAFRESATFFPSQLQQFQFFDKYSRFDWEKGRRETWLETVVRSVDYLYELAEGHQPPVTGSWESGKISNETYLQIYDAIAKMEVMPSMRLLAMAGPAARRNQIALYNCSYVEVDQDALVEALIISMSGTGVGYSVEKRVVDNLPNVFYQKPDATALFHLIEDSSEGWARALKLGVDNWFRGRDVQFDLSQIRPSGAPLKTKGGRASGPEPLRQMLASIRGIILGAQGRKLTSLEWHDMMCYVANGAVQGGVRRSAMICLFSKGDEEMLHCKDIQNCHSADMTNPITGELFGKDLNLQRWNANNSIVWDELPTDKELKDQMDAMVDSGMGEPGIVNRVSANEMRPARRGNGEWVNYGVNPCGEISLKPMQFCNLSAVVLRADDTKITLAKKVRIATIIGTIQSTATHFPGLRPQWKANCEEERLLGVDITGQMDNPRLLTPDVLHSMKELAIRVNETFAKALDINPSASITCVKPSGNTSVLVNCASGLHARYAQYYIRNVTVTKDSPMHKVLATAGVPILAKNDSSVIASFPVKGPEGTVTRHDISCVEQLEHWLKLKTYWTEHNPSASIYYKPEEVPAMIEWLKEHKEMIGGLAFFPKYDTDSYLPTLPYIEISQAEYERRMADFPEYIAFEKLYRYEEGQDLTNASGEIACSAAGGCEVA